MSILQSAVNAISNLHRQITSPPSAEKKLTAEEKLELKDLQDQVLNSPANFWSKNVREGDNVNPEKLTLYSMEFNLKLYKISANCRAVNLSGFHDSFPLVEYEAKVVDIESCRTLLYLPNCRESFDLYRSLDGKSVWDAFSFKE